MNYEQRTRLWFNGVMQPNTQMPPQSPMRADYGFIMQDPQAPKKGRLPGPGGLVGKLLLGCLGLFMFIIVFVIIKNLVSPGADYSGFVSVAQNQQSISQTLTNASKQATLTDPTEEFILMAQLSITNDQQEVFSYLSRNDQKVNTKELLLKIDSKANAKLTTAASTSPGAYETAFREVIKEQLAAYQKELQNTYANFKGQNGRQVLDKAYTNSEMLVKKLETR